MAQGEVVAKEARLAAPACKDPLADWAAQSIELQVRAPDHRDCGGKKVRCDDERQQWLEWR
ncbi:MAG: hypothetical protein ACOX6T_13195, partial [Myxococcales bacterium]